MIMSDRHKPLGRKAYGSIGHLPGSKMGEGDHHCPEGQATICTEKPRDRFDNVIVQEKLDGSCCAVAKLEDGKIIPLGRAGYEAKTSPFYQHILFHEWVWINFHRFNNLLNPGERIVGEWLRQAHGTRYELPHEPFVPFDIMIETKRLPYLKFIERVLPYRFKTPHLISYGLPISIKEVMKRLKESYHGALDKVEGAVWRVERKNEIDFLAKYVRPDKVDGCYLPRISKGEDIWNKYPGYLNNYE